ncbi:MAG: AraC family transcriptional regulator, partial [Bacillota bacterium]
MITDKAEMLGKMNLFQDEAIRTTGMMDYVSRALSGEAIRLTDEPVPLETIVAQYGGQPLPPPIKYSDISTFPIQNGGVLEYLVVIFRVSREYEGRREYIRAKEYIENHWEHFDLDAVATASGLSKSRLSRVFKEFSSMTLSEFWLRVKINRIKEKLLDPNLSVA